MDPLPFLDRTIKTPDGTTYERLSPPITDFRQCHSVVPPERRILYRCRRFPPSSDTTTPHEDREEQFIMKIKVQIPDPTTDTAYTSSDATTHELSALQTFHSAGPTCTFAPRLIAFASHSQPQSPESLLPGGYISCTIMTTLPGKSLFDLGYWSLEEDAREEIREGFLETLRIFDRAVRKLGIEPIDKGLRNVMWDSETKRCGLVDFEMWKPYTPPSDDVSNDTSSTEQQQRTEELQKWGLAHRPAAKNWWAEFGIKTC